jgi:hypothetical protein
MEKYYAGYRKLLLTIGFFFLLTQTLLLAQCPGSTTYQNTQSLPSITSEGFFIDAENNVKVLSGQNVKFQAGTFVTLNPGFSTITGAVFTGTIVPQYPATLSASVSSVLASTGSTCPGGCLQYTLTANPTGVGPYTYYWNTGETSQSIVVAPGASTVYGVSVHDGCLNQNSSAQITVDGIDTHYRGDPTFQFYNAISPNNDGISDHFFLADGGKTQYAFNACYFEFYVYNNPNNEEVNHSTGYAGPNGFKEGDIYWDAMVRDGIYSTYLRLDNCSGKHEYKNWIVIQGSSYPNNGRIAIDSSISLIPIQNIDLYPNPSSGVVNFDFSSEEERDILISIFNNIGNNVYEIHYGKHTRYSSTIDLQFISKGIYTAKVKTGDETIFKKLIVE